MTRVEELFRQVQELTPDEREAFALLFESGSGDDFELSPEWRAEIQRRREDVDNGRSKTIPWEDVEERLEQRLRGGSWD